MLHNQYESHLFIQHCMLPCTVVKLDTHLAMSSARRDAELPNSEFALRSGRCCWLMPAIQDCQSHLYADVQARGLVRMALTHEKTALADRLVALHAESSLEVGWLAGSCGAGGGLAAGAAGAGSGVLHLVHGAGVSTDDVWLGAGVSLG